MKVSWHEMKHELLKLKRRDYEDGKISADEYIAFLREQINQIKE